MNQSATRAKEPASPVPPSIVLVVDDEPTICWAIDRMLTPEGHQVVSVSSAEAGLEFLQQSQPHLILLDVRLPGESGLSALAKFIEASGQAPIILMTAFGDLETAVAAIQRGASDYITKPFSLENVFQACNSALLSSHTHELDELEKPSQGENAQRLVGSSPAMQAVFKQVALVAQSDVAVLITGETGTGKELVAAAIHDNGPRRNFPYLPVALVALNPELIESELFGHVQGAYTGAHRDKPGIFELAEGGTILLDEIGDLPLGTQAKLLRVLEQREFSRVGDGKTRACNVRILAATNCNLHTAVQEGTFRQDLFYRLNGLHIRLPALRDRPDDIPSLLQHFLRQFGYPSQAPVASELAEQLASRSWAGNVRELRNAIEHASVLARGRSLAIRDFPAPPEDEVLVPASDAPQTNALADSVAEWTRRRLQGSDSTAFGLYDELVLQVEKVLLDLTLAHTAGNLSKAAEVLGMHRATLRQKLKQKQGRSIVSDEPDETS